MRSIDISSYEIVKAGVAAKLDRVSVHSLIELMQKNDRYVFWLQRKNSTFESQIPAVCVNDQFYHPSFKLEKAIFRHIRLTRNFQNYELMEDGTKKLRIPLRLWLEKQRTSNKFLVSLLCVLLACFACCLVMTVCADINDVCWQMMYKRTKGECKSKPRVRSLQEEAVDRMLELMDSGAAPMSLIVSPRRRVEELQSVFEAEYPHLDFIEQVAAARVTQLPPSSRACTASQG
jgi:hypothetical protein